MLRGMLPYEFVPNDFGKGVVVPLIKDKIGDSSNLNNYRAVTLTAVCSKLFYIYAQIF